MGDFQAQFCIFGRMFQQTRRGKCPLNFATTLLIGLKMFSLHPPLLWLVHGANYKKSLNGRRLVAACNETGWTGL